MKLPNLKKILKPIWKHKPGHGLIDKKFKKQKVLEQATNPLDDNLLKKLGINKKDKILGIACYYGNWVSKLKQLGCYVVYSDISKSIVKYARKNIEIKFDKYICSNYELIPKKEKEYDWTFTFEACGSKQGLPIAYLRSLLNKKGGILGLYYKRGRMGNKHKTYPKIVKRLSKIYNVNYQIKKIKIKASRKQKYNGNLLHIIYILKTNDSARKKSKLDLRVLDKFKNKKIINLEKETNKLKIKKKEFLESLKRLSKVTSLLDKKFVKEVKLK